MPTAINPNNEAVIVEAESPYVTIWPTTAWTFYSNATLYTAGSYQLTKVLGARAEFKFTGTEVWFYADMNIDHGAYTVQIDDGPAQTQSSYSPNLVMQTMLYTTKVSPGPHTLVITNADSTYLGIDYFAYMPLIPESTSAVVPAHTTPPSSAAGESAAPAAHRGTNGMWVALGLCFVALAIFLVLAFCICRARRRRRMVAHDQEQQQMAYAAATSLVSSRANSLHVVPEPSFSPSWVGGPGSVSVSRAPSSSVADPGPFADHYAVPALAYSERRYLPSSEHTPSEVSGTRTTMFSV